ncbi:Plasma membrane fusion protein PRM1 [Candida viswanathii]|uniref:Plasma membrane fusion protein PRM1 n=1 Tax=Candida viswanathii TaxID=5486 RepID=A0A367XT95_9ASCO|nr:Plasma membrane fusion protein PRM1 [Candida viswanathii]
MFRNYLNLAEILSQTYLNKYAILLLLILIRLVILENSLVSNLSLELLDKSVCYNGEVQLVLNTVHRMVVNNLQTLEQSGLISIILFLKALKQIALFVIELFLGTYVCLLNAVLRGTTEFALDASEGVIQAVNATVVSATNDIESALQGLSQFLNDIVTGVSTLARLFTGNLSQPTEYQNQINITLGELKDKIVIPGSVIDKIEDVRNTSLGGLSTLDNGTQTLVSAPFDLIVNKLNVMRDNFTFKNTAPSPLNFTEECLKDMNKLEEIQRELVRLVQVVSRWIFIGLLCGMVASMLYVGFVQWREWRRMDKFIHEQEIAQEVQFRNQHNIYNNVILYTIEKRMGYKINERFLWMFSYLFSKAARNVFFFGLMGVISVVLQFILINAVQKSLNNHIDDFAAAGNDTSGSVSTYIREMNTYINDTQTGMNDELFGNIKETSMSLNSTIVDFIDSLNETLTDIFGSTPFSGAVDTVVYCTIGRKLEKIESGLTWMNDNLNIDLPLFDGDFQKDLAEIKFLQPQSVLNKVDKLIDVYKRSIWLELYISLGLLGLWLLQVLIGALIVGIRTWNARRRSDDDTSNSITYIQRDVRISSPHELSEKQKQEYGYPLSNPYTMQKYITSSSSCYPSTGEMSKYQ